MRSHAAAPAETPEVFPSAIARSLGRALLITSLGAGSVACAAGAPPSLHVASPTRARAPRPEPEATPEPARPSKAKVGLPQKETSAEVSFSDAGPAAILAMTTARCPAEMALVDARVCVDRWEASLVLRGRGGELPWSPFMAVDGNEPFVRAISRAGMTPQGYISGEQATQACRASGKRLCTADEWVHACRGPTNTTFPYGDARRAGACNDDRRSRHPVLEVAASLGISSSDAFRDAMNNPLINQLPASLLRTAERAECTNAYGLFDMVGNLHEWIDDPEGTFRGGFYLDTSKNGDGCSYQTTAHDVRYHDYSTGFRCCMDPERVE